MRAALRELVREWVKDCRGGFTLSSGYYAGRGANSGDLNSDILERLYKGLRRDVGQTEAANFVRFVNQLNDLSASAFIVAFQQFWANGCQVVEIDQQPGDGVALDAYGDDLLGQAFGAIGSSLFRSKSDDSPRQHERIKAQFISDHWAEIPTDEKGELPFHASYLHPYG